MIALAHDNKVLNLPSERVAPHNIELEQALLGAVMINNDAFHRVSDFLEPSHFYELVHQRIFEIAAGLLRAGKPATPITIKSFLLEDIGIVGMTASQYLARLAAEATTVINAPDYGREIYELAARRSLINIGEEMCTAAYASGPDTCVRQIASGVIEALDGIVASRADAHLARVSIGDSAETAMERLSIAMQNPGRLDGLSWGLRSIDKQTGGLCAGQMTIVAGRPSMGKTAWMTSTAMKVAKSEHPVVFFSLEMAAEPLTDRILADLAYDRERPISYADMRTGALSAAEFDRLDDAARLLRKVPLVIEQQPALSVAQISVRARKHQQSLERNGQTLGLIIVDHLQHVRPSAEYRGRRVDEVTQISRDLAALAKELHVPVVVCAQLSRQVEGRDDKRPQLSDLRDSGSIEQDADVVIFLYREAYYLERLACDDPVEEDKRLARLFEVRNRLELIIAKQRNGPIGIQTVFFDAACNHIDDLEGYPPR
jgi:replicative DNA helicase